MSCLSSNHFDVRKSNCIVICQQELHVHLNHLCCVDQDQNEDGQLKSRGLIMSTSFRSLAALLAPQVVFISVQIRLFFHLFCKSCAPSFGFDNIIMFCQLRCSGGYPCPSLGCGRLDRGGSCQRTRGGRR